MITTKNGKVEVRVSSLRIEMLFSHELLTAEGPYYSVGAKAYIAREESTSEERAEVFSR